MSLRRDKDLHFTYQESLSHDLTLSEKVIFSYASYKSFMA